MDSIDNRVKERILTESAAFYHQHLTDEAKTYLVRERRINDDIISRFQIGFARGGLKKHLIRDLGHQEDLCIKAGVLKKGKNGEVRDYFIGRIVFPNLKRGSVVNFTSRGIDGGAPKYLHLPGEILHLYNEDALDQKEVIITEGVPDCLTAVQAGYAAVALLGANGFKPQFVPKFRRCEKVYVCLDGDAAGAAGTSAIGALLPDKAYVVKLPEGLDLNDYFRNHSVEDFRGLIQSSEKHLQYLLNQIPNTLDRTELPSYLEPILEILARLSPQSTEHFLEHEIKRRFSLTAEEVRAYRSYLVKKRRGSEAEKRARFDQGEPRAQYKAKFPDLIDIIAHNASPTYLLKSGSEILLMDHVDINGIRYVPPPKSQLPWLLPDGQRVLQEYENCHSNPAVFVQRLYDDIVHRLKNVSDLPDDSYYELLALWCFHTYLLEGVQYTPIICLFAVPERGKSRTGKALIHIAYRGIHVESLREAYLYRVAENFGCSIFFDVKDIWRKAEKAGSEDILLQRFEKGAIVPRVLFPEKGPFEDTVYYSIFGPTIIATNEGIDPILETRSIYINMPEARRRFENDVVPEGSLDLKERLTAFRAWHLGQALPEAQKPTPGRLGDILKPLLQVIRLVDPRREAAFVELVGRLQRERLLDKSSSLDAEILRTIHDLSDAVNHGTLGVKMITDQLNLGRSVRLQLSPQRIGRRLNAMGFRKVRTGNGAAAIHYDVHQIEQMFAGFGLEETSETSETSDSSGPRANTPGVTDDSDESDD